MTGDNGRTGPSDDTDRQELPPQDASGESGSSPVSITLTGKRGQQFDRLKRAISRNLGYEPSNPELLGLLMSMVDEERDEVDS